MWWKCPDNFAARLRAAYPNNQLLEHELSTGCLRMERLLGDSIGGHFDADKIIDAFECGKSHTLLEEAKASKERAALYEEWREVREAQKGKPPGDPDTILKPNPRFMRLARKKSEAERGA